MGNHIRQMKADDSGRVDRVGSIEVLHEHYSDLKRVINLWGSPVPYGTDYRKNTPRTIEFQIYSIWPEELESLVKEVIANTIPVFGTMITGESCCGYFNKDLVYVTDLTDYGAATVTKTNLPTDHWDQQLELYKRQKLLKLLED